MDEQQISLKTVFDLRLDASGHPLRFFIPAYQRGFRWDPQQVTQLLEDVQDFIRRENPQPDEFYCLQPLVVRPRDGFYEVVDGQQRLTTLLLILRHFNERLTKKYQQELYTLEYETRADLLDFLEHPSAERASSNIDFFHIDQAVGTIEGWFQQRESEVERMKSALLNNTKLIWFQLAPGESAVAAFTRLNVGKIPLTNGELIRALFLRQSTNDKKDGALQMRIAYEWDLLEKELQNNDFWCFMSNDVRQSGNRIGFLFDLIASAEGMKTGLDAYATFYHYSAKLNAKDSDPEKAWLNVKSTFMLLEEWFKDRRLYHLVGFLIWKELTVSQLIAIANNRTKRSFKQSLLAEAFVLTVERIDPTTITEEELRTRITDRLESLVYPRHSDLIRSILLLFNLATLLLHRQSNLRFQFDSFKTEEWDIEHVRSVAPDSLGTPKAKREWLRNCLGYLKSINDAPELQTEIEAFLELPTKQATDTAFEQLYENVLRVFEEQGGEPDNTIANLVLLDSGTNRSYKNAVFAIKRSRVLSLDRDGVFVPLCTRNVFLKCYNSRVDNLMFWTQDDKNGYRQAIVDTLVAFFQGEWLDA